MIYLGLGFILGVILITFLKSSSMSDYEEKIEKLSNELEVQNIDSGVEIERLNNKINDLKAIILGLKRKNNFLKADNERYKNSLEELFNKYNNYGSR